MNEICLEACDFSTMNHTSNPMMEQNLTDKNFSNFVHQEYNLPLVPLKKSSHCHSKNLCTAIKKKKKTFSIFPKLFITRLKQGLSRLSLFWQLVSDFFPFLLWKIQNYYEPQYIPRHWILVTSHPARREQGMIQFTNIQMNHSFCLKISSPQRCQTLSSDCKFVRSSTVWIGRAACRMARTV